MKINKAGVSKIGLVRKLNEDRFHLGENFFVVADGMGGYSGGATASTIAIDDISDYLRSKDTISENDIENAVLIANGEILKKVSTNDSLSGMGTTVVVASISNNSLRWGNVGDSRLYLLRKNVLRQVSTDHSFVQNLVDSGTIQENEKITHPKKNILTRAVGVSSNLAVDTGEIDLCPGDRILLCSDGLSAYVHSGDIKTVLEQHVNPEEAAHALVEKVYEMGARDNVTIVVVDVI